MIKKPCKDLCEHLKSVTAFFIFKIQSYQSRISHSDRVGKKLQDTASGGHNYCTCTVRSDFTATAVELHEHEEKEQRKKITSAKHQCNAFPLSAVVQSISPSLLLLEMGRVCKSQMFLRSRAGDSVSVSPQVTIGAYGSWENSRLILQSSMVNRKNIDLLHWQNTKRERNFTTCMLSCFTKERVLLGAA